LNNVDKRIVIPENLFTKL